MCSNPRVGCCSFTKEVCMAEKRVVLYGNDQGANNVLDAVEKAAREDGLTVLRIPGLNVPVSDGMREQLFRSDAAVFGISSADKAGIEARLALEALERNPELRDKILFCEDFPGSSGVKNPDHQMIGQDAHLCSIMVLPDDETEHTIYRNVWPVGLPDHWYPSMENIREGAWHRGRGELRKRQRGNSETVPIMSNDVIVYFSGFKDPKKEADALRVLLSVESINGRPVLVHFRPHPGEKNQPELQRAIAERDALLAGCGEIASPEIVDAGKFTHARLIGAADVVVAHPGCTENFQCAALRHPMICPMGLVSERDRRESTYDYALTARNTYFIESHSLDDLLGAVAVLSDPSSPESVALRRKQKRNALSFDPEKPPMYGKNVVAVLRSLLG